MGAPTLLPSRVEPSNWTRSAKVQNVIKKIKPKKLGQIQGAPTLLPSRVEPLSWTRSDAMPMKIVKSAKVK